MGVVVDEEADAVLVGPEQVRVAIVVGVEPGADAWGADVELVLLGLLLKLQGLGLHVQGVADWLVRAL